MTMIATTITTCTTARCRMQRRGVGVVVGVVGVVARVVVVTVVVVVRVCLSVSYADHSVSFLGKGTQCAKILEAGLNMVHYSVSCGYLV